MINIESLTLDQINELGIQKYNEGYYEEAFNYFNYAAEQGYAPAQNSLAFMYTNGEGVEQNYEEAIKWYTLAAEQGYASAQNN